MIGIGKLLRQAREEQQLSLAEVESKIKIRRRYLEALEAEEFEILPGHVYMFGFVRNYASFLGLDADYIVSQLKTQFRSDEEWHVDVKPVRNSLYRRKSLSLGRLFKIVAILMAIVLAGAYLYTYWSGGRFVDGVATPPEHVQVEEPALGMPSDNVNEAAQAETPLLEEGIEVVLSVSDEPGARCWIEVRSDGEVSFSGTLEKGETRSFTADEKLQVKVGNPGVLSVLYNGEDLGIIGPKNKVITLEFPPQLQGE